MLCNYFLNEFVASFDQTQTRFVDFVEGKTKIVLMTSYG